MIMETELYSRKILFRFEFLLFLIQRKSNTSKTNVLLSIGEQERALSAAIEEKTQFPILFHFIPPLCWLLLPIFH